MKRKSLRLSALCAVLVLLLSACGTSSAKDTARSAEDTESATENTETVTEETAEGYDILGGQLWEVSGVYAKGRVFDLHDSKELESMYRANYLSFQSDGSFLYHDLFPKGGTYEPYESSEADDCFLLKTNTAYRYDTDTGKLVENESGTKKPYIIYILDENTLQFAEFDSMTGKAKSDDIPLFFTKSHEDSSYIRDHKAELSQSGSNSSATEKDEAYNNSSYNNNYSNDDSTPSYTGGGSSYQSILDEYTEKMEKAVPGLVSEYRSESSGISDIESLAKICNEKVGKLASICNEGVGEMAKLMNSSGDSYSTYESWAGKLMDQYTDIAQEIQDAYLDSAAY